MHREFVIYSLRILATFYAYICYRLCCFDLVTGVGLLGKMGSVLCEHLLIK